MNKIVRNPAKSPARSPAFAVTGSGASSTTWTSRIAASGDDGYWTPSMNFDNSSSTTKVGFDGMMFDDIHSFFRFQNVTIPNATVISSATLSLVVGANASATFNMSIKGEDVDDSSAYSDETDAESATETSASVTWAGSSGWATSDVEVSPEIKTIIQEIVNRTGWSSGNDLTLRLKYSGSGMGGEEYAFKTYDDSAGVSALLTIKY